MAGNSGLLKEGRYAGRSAPKPPRYSGDGQRSGASGSSKSKRKCNNLDDDTTANSKTSREVESCESPATTITVPVSQSNNGNSRQDRVSNNSNRASSSVSGSSSSSNRSYSKIFRQYLPNSLNLNYTPNSGGIKSELAKGEAKEVGKFKANRETVTPEKSLHQIVESGQSANLLAKSIANTLSRFRISYTSVKDKQASDSLLESDQSTGRLQTSAASSELIRREKRTYEADRNHHVTKSKQTQGERQVNDNSNYSNDDSDQKLLDRQVKVRFDFNSSDKSENKGSTSSQAEQKVRRRGFLYLKKGNKKGGDSLQISGDLLSGCKRFNQKDPNNNSISSLLSNTCHDEHTTCLLDEQEEEDEDDNNNNNNKIDYDEQDREEKMLKGASFSIARQKVCFKQTIASETKGAKKMSNNSNRSKSNTELLLAGSLMLTFLIGFSALLSSVALAQQQVPPSSFRSQPSTQANGPQSALNGGSVNRSPPPQPVAGSLVANINCNKIRGHVTLTPNLRGGTTVTTQISAGPPGEVYQWSVHQFPVKPGAAMCSCSALILGTKLIDLSEMHGNLPSDQEFNVQSSLNLFGSESPVGHSLMLRGMKTGMVACATFLPTSRKSNYRAKFHTPLSGSVTIFQTAFGTSFISHLMYSNGTRRHSMHRFDLLKSEEDIVTTSLLNGGQSVSSAPSGGRAENQMALEMREHDNELSQCRRFTNGEALFKNISNQLSVSTENFGMRGRTSLVLPQIPFETFSSVYLVVYSEYDPSEPIACAPLKFVKPKTAAAKFQSVSVQGSVVFSQDSPYDVTVARINLNLPNSDGHSYGIDELPMIIRRKSDTRVCPNIREIIYNPHHVEPSSVPPEGEATSDQYAVGDLSGKYGSLTGKASEKIQVNDFNLPLFGPISIVGRAMTIYSAEGVAIACSNVELTTPMTTAFATFDYGIQGQFIFRQPVNDCNGDTYVYIEVSKPVQAGGSQTHPQTSSITSSSNGADSSSGQHEHNMRSLDHNWHIHVNPVDSGLDHLSTTDCLPAGPHYNPYNTSTASIYSRDCTPFNVLRCELGDLSAKMFTIDIPPYRVKGGQEPDIGKFFGTDIDLPLCGPVSVVNRSVVVHVQDFGVQRLACSTVIEFKPRSSN